jgi:hypothetical protein
MPIVIPISPGGEELEESFTLADLRGELYARGYDHLAQDAATQARADRFLNQAHAELCLEELWPFRLTSISGAAPLAVSDIDRILTVVDSDNGSRVLYELTEREATAMGLATAGSPMWFYRDSLLVRVLPDSATTLLVRYYMLPPELVDSTDSAIIPKRYMNVVVDSAVIRAAADRDNDKAALLADTMYQRGLSLMRRQLLVAQTHIEHIAGTSEDD